MSNRLGILGTVLHCIDIFRGSELELDIVVSKEVNRLNTKQYSTYKSYEAYTKCTVRYIPGDEPVQLYMYRTQYIFVPLGMQAYSCNA